MMITQLTSGVKFLWPLRPRPCIPSDGGLPLVFFFFLLLCRWWWSLQIMDATQVATKRRVQFSNSEQQTAEEQVDEAATAAAAAATAEPEVIQDQDEDHKASASRIVRTIDSIREYIHLLQTYRLAADFFLSMLQDELARNKWPELWREIRRATRIYRADYGRQPDIVELNRYHNVVAYDHTRVRLQRGPIDYINANYVYAVDQYRSWKLWKAKYLRTYILCSAPIMITMQHFWLMVWEQRSEAVVVVTRLIEFGRDKCYKYWPDKAKPIISLTNVRLRIELVEETETEYYVSRTSRIIKHFYYLDWPDVRVPVHTLEFLEFLHMVRRSREFTAAGPPVIHCSAGIGRAGTFTFIDACLTQLERYPGQDVNVKEMVVSLRDSRYHLIQTCSQLEFACHIVDIAHKNGV